ncbi:MULTISPECIES: DUF1579 domain-containing protein [unclassified Arthrobacter]|uniref:DUF1579 domain-containing protein n=1 Tax=unclassified Arthrobacter TaxID=235627 RepID=UPI00339AB2F5
MNAPQPGTVHAVLEDFLGHWRGTTRLAASAWGPERSAVAEISFTRAAGGFAVVQSYRHTEANGTHFDGHGVFTVDPDHHDVFWYYVDSTGLPPGTPVRCTWVDGVLRVERHSDRGTARHTFQVADGVLTYSAGLRLGEGHSFGPFMTCECRRA